MDTELWRTIVASSSGNLLSAACSVMGGSSGDICQCRAVILIFIAHHCCRWDRGHTRHYANCALSFVSLDAHYYTSHNLHPLVYRKYLYLSSDAKQVNRNHNKLKSVASGWQSDDPIKNCFDDSLT